MKIGIITQGSNGDAELFVAMALQMAKKKHQVELFIITLNNRDYSFLNDTPGIRVYQKHIHSEFKSEKENVEFWKESKGLIFKKIHDLITDDLTEFSYKFMRNDIVMSSHYIFELACISEKYSVPYISIVSHLEIIRTNDEWPFTLSHMKEMNISKAWDIYEGNYNVYLKRLINKFRRLHGLTPISNVIRDVMCSGFLNLIPFSRVLFKAKPDWDDSFKVCGFWKSPDDYNAWEIPADLEEFLQRSEKTVFMTVGSMAEHEYNSTDFQNLLLKTANQIKGNVIILTNWETGNCMEGNIYKLKGFVSYPKILRRCYLAVHHGGIGIIHHATEAGCSSVVIKYGHDQPYNAKILYDLGISGGSIYRKDLSPEKLATLINSALENKALKQKAEMLAPLLKSENGVKNAVNVIEETISKTISL